MTVAYVQSWSGGGSSSANTVSTLTVSGATANNLLVAVVAIRSGASASFTGASGWTKICDVAGTVAGAMYYRIASGTSADNFSPNWGVSARFAFAASEYSGLVTSSVLDTSAENESQVGSTTTTVSTGSASPSVAGFAVAFYAGNHDASAVESDLTIGSSFTKRVTTDPTLAINRAQAAIADLDLTGTSSVSATWTSATSVAGTYAACAVFVEPATGKSIVSVVPSAFDDGKTGIVITVTGMVTAGATVFIDGVEQTVTGTTSDTITITAERSTLFLGSAQLKVVEA
jgi:hypothetical protein